MNIKSVPCVAMVRYFHDPNHFAHNWLVMVERMERGAWVCRSLMAQPFACSGANPADEPEIWSAPIHDVYLMPLAEDQETALDCHDEQEVSGG